MKTTIYNTYKTTEWSGGKTTELFIYPEGGDYCSGNFLARVSSATVETETSDFTKLPGVYRMLMVLEGQMDLSIKGNAPISMGPYDICAFSGDWDTKSRGKVRDFNLMVRENMQGDVSFLSLGHQTQMNFPRSLKKMAVVVYVLEGEGTLNGEGIKAKDTIVLDDYCGETCDFGSTGEMSLKLAVCRIWENPED